MGDLDKIPPHLLKKFDEIKWESVESNLKLGHYREWNKKYAELYVDHHKSERDASLSARREARADSAFRISKKHLIIATIAIALAAIAIIVQNLS